MNWGLNVHRSSSRHADNSWDRSACPLMICPPSSSTDTEQILCGDVTRFPEIHFRYLVRQERGGVWAHPLASSYTARKANLKL